VTVRAGARMLVLWGQDADGLRDDLWALDD
jgi:hypothetical protein